MVVWLENRVDAEYLRRTGTAMLGSTDAFCSPFIVRDNSGLCYHCNRYGHKRASCTSYIRCAICSKGHRRDECTNRDSPKCPALGDAHTGFDWACKLHPQQYRHVGQERARTRQDENAASKSQPLDLLTVYCSTDRIDMSQRNVLVSHFAVQQASGSLSAYAGSKLPECVYRVVHESLSLMRHDIISVGYLDSRMAHNVQQV
jgi:hypothetical protein